jgi:hypothetical protein
MQSLASIRPCNHFGPKVWTGGRGSFLLSIRMSACLIGSARVTGFALTTQGEAVGNGQLPLFTSKTVSTCPKMRARCTVMREKA